jgi:hypothetical protein
MQASQEVRQRVAQSLLVSPIQLCGAFNGEFAVLFQIVKHLTSSQLAGIFWTEDI